MAKKEREPTAEEKFKEEIKDLGATPLEKYKLKQTHDLINSLERLRSKNG